jgi:Fic family protein
LLDGFEGKLTTEKWGKLTKVSHDTALRDIQDLIKKGVLRQEEVVVGAPPTRRLIENATRVQHKK